VFNKIWSVVAVAAVAIASYMSGAGALMSLINLAGIVFVLGVAQSWKHANAFGAIFAFALGVYSYEVGYISNAVVQFAFVTPLSLWGWYNWCKRDVNGEVTTKAMTYKSMLRLCILSLGMFLGFILLSCIANAAMPVMDAITATLPIMATILLVKAYKEQWYLWITFNTMSAYMWFVASSNDASFTSLLVLKIVFLVNSLIGFYNWKNKE